MRFRLILLREDAVKFQSMVDEPVTEPLGDFTLQGFDFSILEFDNLTAFDIDQMVVVRFRYFLVARPAIAKIVPIQNAMFFE